jgi:hypothetical protein
MSTVAPIDSVRKVAFDEIATKLVDEETFVKRVLSPMREYDDHQFFYAELNDSLSASDIVEDVLDKLTSTPSAHIAIAARNQIASDMLLREAWRKMSPETRAKTTMRNRESIWFDFGGCDARKISALSRTSPASWRGFFANIIFVVCRVRRDSFIPCR